LNFVIDIGNTQTKVAIFNGNEIVHFSKHNTLSEAIVQEIVKLHKPSRAIFSSVGICPEGIENWLSSIDRVLEFKSTTPIPLKNSYTTTETLGSDRLAAAVGANLLYEGRNVLAIGCGTAITYDFVTAAGEYIGGAISPGIGIRFKALNEFTAKLPLVEIDEKFPILATTTKDSILSGVLNGTTHELDGYIDALHQNFSDFEVILTGGDANFFVGKLKNAIFVLPNLVLIGLNRISNYND
jgi:type III pantothenate kinase